MGRHIQVIVVIIILLLPVITFADSLSYNPAKDIVLRIDRIDGLQGHINSIDILIYQAPYKLGGLNFKIAYDNRIFTFTDVHIADGFELLRANTESFSWDTSTVENENNTSILSLSCESNFNPNKEYNQIDTASLPVAILTLDFLTTNDRTVACEHIPLDFYWSDCTDNSIINDDGSHTFISKMVIDCGYNYMDSYSIFPSYNGPIDNCFSSNPDMIQNIIFYNGGIEFRCDGWLSDNAGDIDRNGTYYELSDLLMFTEYFLIGIDTLDLSTIGLRTQSDMNQDDISLGIDDYVLLTRFITSDELYEMDALVKRYSINNCRHFPSSPPYPGLPVPEEIISWTPDSTNTEAIFRVNDSKKRIIIETGDSLGAVNLVFDGHIIPELTIENMKMRYNHRDNETHIIIYQDSVAGKFVSTGKLLKYRGEGVLNKVETATYFARPVRTRIIIR